MSVLFNKSSGLSKARTSLSSGAYLAKVSAAAPLRRLAIAINLALLASIIAGIRRSLTRAAPRIPQRNTD